MTFSDALESVKAGAEISREGWNGKGMWVKISHPGKGAHITLPFLYMKTANDETVPWVASQTDILANDWLATPV